MTTGICAAIAQPPGEGWVQYPPAAKPRRVGLLGALRGTGTDEDLTGWAAATAAGLPGPKADPSLTGTVVFRTGADDCLSRARTRRRRVFSAFPGVALAVFH